MLLTKPAFIAKNRLPSVGAHSICLQPIKTVDTSPIARLHCPVRALKFCLRRTKERGGGGRTRLFLPIQQGREDISAQSISAWFRQVIRCAYEDLAPGGVAGLRIKAHEVRAVSASVALQRNCAVNDIVAAFSWKSDSTFAKVFLRDRNRQATELDRLGVVAVAQHVLPAASD